ncbi:hypothetical protein ABIF38_006376 [Bradyrhizobium japonicum]|uniref:Uncharacterized protein n=1 Tax=Bradyrhizobium elkanii TaxID=29448 RepID=A0ABV4F1F2_BRAEL|nr:hypothetical protein [Bradyrhizobium elkanii]
MPLSPIAIFGDCLTFGQQLRSAVTSLTSIDGNDQAGLLKYLNQSIKDQPLIGARTRFKIFLKDLLGRTDGSQGDVFVRHSSASKINFG